ncbi:MAG TPA: pyruvate kinase [Elusimicrobiales bacterium]|nr:pyruvate kinase [Elusimicrobiales bacterium]
MPRTRIIATLGPASADSATLRKMMRAGLDMARFNFSHGTHADHLRALALLRSLNTKERRAVKTLQDLQGNRIRIGALKAPFELKKRQRVVLFQGAGRGDAGHIPFDYPGPLKPVRKGHSIYIDDARIALRVESAGRGEIRAVVTEGGLLKPRKGVNIPEARLEFPVLNDEDRRDIQFGASCGFDAVAQSFVLSAEQVDAVRALIKPRRPKCRVFAKIEHPDAVKNIDAILEAADGIMIARGDLGITMPVWRVPVMQKLLIRKANLARKPVITATQMLESMTESSLPTRAEASDVANAILDGTDYVMLSGETAAGKYPDRAVRMMNEIIKYTEAHEKGLCSHRNASRKKASRRS